MSALIIYKSAKYHVKYINQNGSRKIVVRCSANVLRLNTGGEKHKLASNVKTKLCCII